jgi:hypothetical protein
MLVETHQVRWYSVSSTCKTCVKLVACFSSHVLTLHACFSDSACATENTNGLQAWLDSSDMQLPTPAAKDLMSLMAAEKDNQRLRRQLEALREAELEMAAREAEENAKNFAILVRLLHHPCMHCCWRPSSVQWLKLLK